MPDHASFAAWFAGSQLADADGAPQVLYHGTTIAFDTPRLNAAGLFFLTPDRASAVDVVENRPDPRILRMHASVRNAFDSTDPTAMQAVIDHGRALGWIQGNVATLTHDQGAGAADTFSVQLLRAGDYVALEAREVIAAIKQLGHDAIKMVERGMTNYAVFDPGQVRLATDVPRPWEDLRVAPNGQPVSANFCEWFEGGQVLTDAGEPMVVYHGARQAFDRFRPSPQGTFGTGIYFANTANSAHEYGATHVVEAFVHIKNPWRVDADCESDAALAEDFDCPIVEAVLRLPRGRALLEQAKLHESGHFGKSLQNALTRLGHDGIIATYGDGSREIIAFRPEQVKCARNNSGLYVQGSAEITDRSVLAAENAREYLAGLGLPAKKALALTQPKL